MKHRIRTVKFKYGRNANKMLVRKLLKNFIVRGKITTTEKRIKVVKQKIEKAVRSAKENTEASRILLRSSLADRKVEDTLFKHVAPVFKDKVSGFTTLIHLTQRDSDGAAIARLQWSLPVVLEKPVAKKPKQKENADENKKPAVEAKSRTKKIKKA